MLEDAPLDMINRDDIVLDPVLGFGSTLITAEKISRCCRSGVGSPFSMCIGLPWRGEFNCMRQIPRSTSRSLAGAGRTELVTIRSFRATLYSDQALNFQTAARGDAQFSKDIAGGLSDLRRSDAQSFRVPAVLG
jgi:hypothetical protein